MSDIEYKKKYLILHGHKQECLDLLPEETIDRVYKIVKELFNESAD